jgi:hypothetical protein
MDENDLFAELDAITSSTTKPSANTEFSASTNATTNKDLEDELFELLNSTTTPARTEKIESKEPVSKPTVTSDVGDQDFLSWLEETPNKSTSTDMPTTTVPASTTVPSNTVTEAKAPSSTTEVKPTSINDQSMDSFLNDVFEVSSPLSSTTNPTVETTKEKKNMNNQNMTPLQLQNELKKKHVEYEKEIESIVDSPYPDLGMLRGTLDKGGYLPSRLRLKILVLLLTGSCHIDDEALNFSATTMEKQFFIDLVPDCEALIDSQKQNYQHPKQLIENISDVVYLYCQRRSLDYKNVYSRIMLSILGTNEDISKSVLSSCFYSLSSNFLPLVGLQVRV